MNNKHNTFIEVCNHCRIKNRISIAKMLQSRPKCGNCGTRFYNEAVEEALDFCIQKGKEKWPHLTEDEIITLVSDDSLTTNSTPKTEDSFHKKYPSQNERQGIQVEKITSNLQSAYDFDQKILGGSLLKMLGRLFGA